MAKARCSDSYVLAANEAVQLHGGIDITDEHDTGFFMQPARACELNFGDVAHFRERYAQLNGYSTPCVDRGPRARFDPLHQPAVQAKHRPLFARPRATRRLRPVKAMLCKAFGPPESLVLEEQPQKPLGPGQVRIAVHAAGVNFPDVLMIQGKYQFKPPFPFAPGAEVAGQVTEVAPDVTTVKVGERVMAMVGAGGFADEAIAAAVSCMTLPKSMDYTVAAGFSMTYGTSYYALVQRAQMQPGEVLLVHGAAGGVGTAAVDIGKKLGAKIIATGGSDEKLARIAKHYGIEHTINYKTETNWKEKVRAITGGKGADVVYDAVGGELLETSLRCLNWNGRVLVIGFAGGDIPKVPANLVLLKSASLIGVFWGAWLGREPDVNRKNFQTMFEWYEAGALKPIISHTFPLPRAADALNCVINREVVGKCVITTGR